MVTNKRKKRSRHRGSHTHSGGAKKKRRGAGSRGGKGRAGSGKRGDQKKPDNWKNKKYFGKHGFKRPKSQKKEVKTINIGFINNNIDRFGEEKNGIFIIDLKEEGYDKLLGSGDIDKKIKITVDEASKGAISKVKEQGGEVITKEVNEE